MDILFSTERIAERIAAMGNEITEFYRDRPLTVIALMNGGICFAADLSRAIALPIWLDSIGVASYANRTSTGTLDFRSTLKLDPKGREILLLDEVLDTGTTLKHISENLRALGAAGVHTAVMVEKEIPRPNGLAHADWAGFLCPQRYLVGYGLDADERYRNLPYIAAID